MRSNEQNKPIKREKEINKHCKENQNVGRIKKNVDGRMKHCRTAQTAAIIPAKLSRKINGGKTSNGTRIQTTLQTVNEE